MRYVMVVVGLALVAFGTLAFFDKPPSTDGLALDIRRGVAVVSGVLLFSIGCAAIEIIAAKRSTP